MNCPSCGAPNEAGRKFCGECGTKLAATCPACGSANSPGLRFCGECGTRLDAAAPAVQPAAVAPMVAAAQAARQSAPQTERRIVSILFADLVGFTARADGNDPEHVREFLARYFDICREIVERYGGTVEKFIGDAVMAVWGTPVAREDDPERAVRSALDLVDGVRRLGKETGDESLALRAGVLTGEAAVTVAAVGQGMVAGDLVNTASRLQSVAPPGSVLVGESTYRVASRAIAFEEAGDQVLKGKASPVAAWRALRVVAERGGLGRSEGIEAPFVGRDDELRLLKDVLHATSRERRVRLVSVTGQAGVGKSRLAWEFLKYIDGVLEDIYWHQGRSPSFGDGVTFWALGEMVRRRAKLAETDDEATTRTRIAEALAEYVPDAAERRRIEPTLLSLLGVGEPSSGGREELFAALRTFFERIAIRGTTVLVFEDLQWADDGVLDFIDHLLEWSIGYPILVVTLARPELYERRPNWGAGRREFIALSLGPLDDAAIRDLLLGLVPELPDRTLRAIIERADGIPLYAVETVRMLTADGRLVEADGRYRIVGQLGDLRVPDTLQSLIASRLDALDPTDRSLLQDGAVLGQTFSVAALAALTGEDVEALEARLRALVRREVLQLDTDPRSPERGQFGFTQALVREVAYGTLSKRDRRTKHLAAARYFESLDDDEVAAVLATHYVDAWAASPDGPEGEAVAAQARIALIAAADRAEQLGSHGQAIALLERARSVTPDESARDELLERIGLAHRAIGHYETAIEILSPVVDRHRERGDRIAVARATMGLASALNLLYRSSEAIPLLLAAEKDVSDLGPDPTVVRLRSMLARAYMGGASVEDCIVWADRALQDAERLDLVPVIADALATKGSVYGFNGRIHEGEALLEAGLRLAEANGLGETALRAAVNLAAATIESDPRSAVAVARHGLEIARRYGFQGVHLGLLANATEASLPIGDFDWIEAEIAALDLSDLEAVDRISMVAAGAEIAAIRGRDSGESVDQMLEMVESTDDVGYAAALRTALAIIALASARYEDAFAYGMAVAPDPLNAPLGLGFAARAAVRIGDAARAAEAIARLEEIGARGRVNAANRSSLGAAVAALDGRWSDALPAFVEVWRAYDDLGLRLAKVESQIDFIAVAPPDEQQVTQVAESAREALAQIGAAAVVAQLDAMLRRRLSPEKAAEPTTRSAEPAARG